MQKPNLTFFSELPADELEELLEDQEIIERLQNLEAGISLGILDLSDKRAEVIKRLNETGIPVTAWLLLPEEEGYWFNVNNYEQAAARYISFKAWTTQHKLQWEAIGLDIEVDINELRSILEEEKAGSFIKTIWQRYFNKPRVIQAQQAYQALVDLIRADGYLVESYHIPLISEERRAKSTVLQRTAGLVDLETDREVLMLYSSFLRPDGASVLWSYAPEADSIGVGSTGGGVDVQGVIDVEPLSWEEFERDLRLCVMREKPVHVFSLEGCVNQGFLKRLETFDWKKRTRIPGSVRKVNAFRTVTSVLLWILERPWILLITLAGLTGLGFLFRRRSKN
ncbi:MAG: hypothetical protein ACOCYU_00175 [Brevefilum sp.]